jgi:hypothetical protein
MSHHVNHEPTGLTEVLALGGDGSELRLQLARKPGASWHVVARISVQAGPWSGTLDATFHEDQVGSFTKELRAPVLPRTVRLGGQRSPELVLTVQEQIGGAAGTLALMAELAWTGDDPYPFLRWLIFDVPAGFGARAADAIDTLLRAEEPDA